MTKWVDVTQCVGIDGVAEWLGRSKSTVYKYCLEPHSPKPDRYLSGVRYWRRAQESDWREWFKTYGPKVERGWGPGGLRGLSPEKRAELAAELRGKYEAGATIRGLSAEYGFSYGSVHRLLDKPRREHAGAQQGIKD